ncbi:hypothetical protein GCM10023092_21800 [Rurimicrobium arvi]|uniref:DUF3892 domain-containing protein n=2 Tax=Rurimicrobium arvi TaxID=2049916 RepID=A0ABP8MYX1_9BACT
MIKMAKTSDYYISGVWKDSSQVITHVMLHPVTDNNGFHRGEKTIESEVIKLIKQGNIIKTITWGYPGWNIGAKVGAVTISGREYLKTDANATVKDNLDNSISMTQIK